MNNDKIQNVIIIDIDGLRRDVLYTTMAQDTLRDEKQLPYLHKILGDIYFEGNHTSESLELENNYNIIRIESLVVNHCTTIFPSYTLPAQTTIFTGKYPKNHGITANFTFDRGGDSFGADGKPKNYDIVDAVKFFVGEGTGEPYVKQSVMMSACLCISES